MVPFCGNIFIYFTSVVLLCLFSYHVVSNFADSFIDTDVTATSCCIFIHPHTIVHLEFSAEISAAGADTWLHGLPEKESVRQHLYYLDRSPMEYFPSHDPREWRGQISPVADH